MVASFSVVPSFEDMFPLLDDLVVIMGLSDASQLLDCQFEQMVDVHHPEGEWLEILEIICSYPTLCDIQKQNPAGTLHVKHAINTEQHPPIHQKPYKVSRNEREIIQGQVNDMLKQNVIQPSTSLWSSPVVLAKKNG